MEHHVDVLGLEKTHYANNQYTTIIVSIFNQEKTLAAKQPRVERSLLAINGSDLLKSSRLKSNIKVFQEELNENKQNGKFQTLLSRSFEKRKNKNGTKNKSAGLAIQT